MSAVQRSEMERPSSGSGLSGINGYNKYLSSSSGRGCLIAFISVVLLCSERTLLLILFLFLLSLLLS